MPRIITLYFIALGETFGVPFSLIEGVLDNLEDERRLPLLQDVLRICNEKQSRQLIFFTCLETPSTDGMDGVSLSVLGDSAIDAKATDGRRSTSDDRKQMVPAAVMVTPRPRGGPEGTNEDEIQRAFI